MALAVNLLVPFASASPLFVEICAGHETILIPAPDAPETGVCETCVVGCLSLAPPDDRSVSAPGVHAVSHDAKVPVWSRPHTILRRNARAPPVLSI